MKEKIFILQILLSLAGFSSLINTQQIVVSGKVNNIFKNPLPYTNILTIPKKEQQDLTLAISENNGNYNLILAKNTYLNP